MIAIRTTLANTEQFAMPLPTLHPRETTAIGDRRVADTVPAWLRWAREAAAIDAEDIVMQAEEALSLG